MAKNQIKPLKGLKATAEVVLSNEVGNVPVQPVEVRATLDKTGRKDKQDYKGYMMLFKDLNKVIPVNGGDILRLQEQSGIQLFEVTEEGHVLLENREFGFTNGQLTIAE